jgi:signal peptidase I
VIGSRRNRTSVGGQRGWLATLASVGLGVVLLAAWVALAPSRLGGQASYVIVVGNSMEPRFHRGDLVVIREAPDYHVGDVATYLHPQIGPVIHRIVDRAGDRYVFKGDNNSWLDPYQPTQELLLGKLWFDIPAVGAVIELLRTPWSLALIAGLMAAIALASALGPQDPWRKAPRMSTRFMKIDHETAQGILTLLVAGAFGFGAFAIYAFSQPVQRFVGDDTGYQQAGEFHYTAAVPAGAVYDSEAVNTGEPVFRRLASEVDFSFDYRFTADEPTTGAGSHRLSAVVSDINGWKRTIELQPATPFEGTGATAQGTLDLNQVQALTDAMQAESGVQRQEYTVTVAADVAMHGTVAGREVREQFAPRVVFKLDPVQLQLAPTGRDSDPLRPSQSGLLKGSRVEPNTLALLILRLNVAAARALAVCGIALSLVAAVALGSYLLRRTDPADEASRIEAKYGDQLLSVLTSDTPRTKHVYELASMDELVKLAERGGHMILHTTTGITHSYVVQDADKTYRYRTEVRPRLASVS